MSDTVTIRLFGPMRVMHGQVDVTPKLTSAQRAIALLCLRPGFDRSRADVGRLLWPDGDEAAVRPRLRTALSAARAVLPPGAITEGDRLRLRLEPEGLDVDLWTARYSVRRAESALDPADEERAWKELLECAELPLLDGMNDSWIVQERERWSRQCQKARENLTEACVERKDLQSALDWAREAVRSVPNDEAGWIRYLRLSVAAGCQGEAIESFRKARSRGRKEGAPAFGRALNRLYEAVRTTPYALADLSAPQVDLAGRLLQGALEQEPRRALAILASPFFRNEVVRQPEEAAEFLERALASDPSPSDDAFQCMTYAMIAQNLMFNRERSRHWAERLLAEDSDHARLRAAGTILAFQRFQVRDWEGAEDAIRVSVAHADALGDTVGVALARAQGALLDWHRLRFDAALATYEESLAAIDGSDDVRVPAATGVICANVGAIYHAKGRHAEALSWLRRADAYIIYGGHAVQFDAVKPLLGLLLILDGDADAGIESLLAGIRLSHRRVNPYQLFSNIEVAAAALAHLGEKSLAADLIETIAAHREAFGSERTPSEKLGEAHVLAQCGGRGTRRDWSLSEAAAVAVRALNALRSA